MRGREAKKKPAKRRPVLFCNAYFFCSLEASAGGAIGAASLAGSAGAGAGAAIGAGAGAGAGLSQPANIATDSDARVNSFFM